MPKAPKKKSAGLDEHVPGALGLRCHGQALNWEEEPLEDTPPHPTEAAIALLELLKSYCKNSAGRRGGRFLEFGGGGGGCFIYFFINQNSFTRSVTGLSGLFSLAGSGDKLPLPSAS